ncbi:uncharacterized protein LOC107607430 [Arachis ipaensis]|uniref:uncharacterized protein LOC107607430 n=1 Tax=Arachis ipaensis TaxID=130454 RepID=UPI0007AF7587|nr:uncharacterized protein LOC107607430 [Arachis ipaensis]XP_029150118.1 uncharacterized protein LOC114925644 [Arachis hypogaea]
MDPAVMLHDQPVPKRGGPWKDICQLHICELRLREKMISGLLMDLGNGRKIQFWEDSWLPNGVLKDLFPRLYSVSTLNGSVSSPQLREDSVVWKFDRTGVYSTKSFPQALHAEVLPEEVTSYSFTSDVWKGFIPPRIELLSWFVLIGRVNTKDRLGRLHVIDQNDTLCVLCCKSEETAFHLFIGCEIRWQVWCAWLFAFGRSCCLPGTLKDHIESWTTSVARKVDRKRWFIEFFAVVWTIWLERNSRLFRN